MEERVRLEELGEVLDFDIMREQYFSWLCYERDHCNRMLSDNYEFKPTGRTLEAVKKNLFDFNLILDEYEKGNYEYFDTSFSLYMRYKMKYLMHKIGFSSLSEPEKMQKEISEFGKTIVLDGEYTEEGVRKHLCDIIGMQFIPASMVVDAINQRDSLIDSLASINDKQERDAIQQKINSSVSNIAVLADKTMLTVMPFSNNNQVHFSVKCPKIDDFSLSYSEIDIPVKVVQNQGPFLPVINVPSSEGKGRTF